jgi:hypothetical protein
MNEFWTTEETFLGKLNYTLVCIPNDMARDLKFYLVVQGKWYFSISFHNLHLLLWVNVLWYLLVLLQVPEVIINLI